MASSSAAGKHGAKPTGHWLDELPIDVLERVALHLSHGVQNRFALSLAQCGAKQADAVVRALKYRLDTAVDFDHWAPIFGRRIRELACIEDDEQCMDVEHFDAVIQADFPNVEYAEITEVSTALRVLSKAPRLRSVKFSCSDVGDSREETRYSAISRLLDLFRVVSLRELRIACIDCECYDDGCSCCCLVFEETGLGPIAMASLLGDISKLDMRCQTHPANEWLVCAAHLLRLRHVVLRDLGPDTGHLDFLKKLETVQLYGVSDGLHVASTLGGAITALEDFDIDREAVSKLVSCRNLTRIAAVVIEDERTFASTLRCFPLKALRLDWSRYTQFRSEEQTYGHRLVAAYHSVSLSIIEAIRGLPNLMELGLFHVRIGLSDLTCILKHLGSRMTHFGTSARFQKESFCERLGALVKAISRYNTNLIDFELRDPRDHEYYDRGENQMTRSQFEELRVGHQWLLRCLPAVRLRGLPNCQCTRCICTILHEYDFRVHDK